MVDLFGDPVPVQAGTALFSSDRRYRYVLTRWWGGGDPLVIIGLNPSTADETVDDPTIRRCIGFARSWGFAGLLMLNLFAFRATDPSELRAVADPVGPENDQHLIAQSSGRVVLCAWGASMPFLSRVRARKVVPMLGRAHLTCLGRTADGSPRHPLYVKADREREAFLIGEGRA